MVVALSLAGLVTYALYPAAPPWLAARERVIEPVHRLSGAGWADLGLPRAGALLTQTTQFVGTVDGLDWTQPLKTEVVPGPHSWQAWTAEAHDSLVWLGQLWGRA